MGEPHYLNAAKFIN